MIEKSAGAKIIKNTQQWIKLNKNLNKNNEESKI